MSAAALFASGVGGMVRESLQAASKTDAYPRWLQAGFTGGISLACFLLWQIGSDVTSGVEAATAELAGLNHRVEQLTVRLERVADRQDDSGKIITDQAEMIGRLEERVRGLQQDVIELRRAAR